MPKTKAQKQQEAIQRKLQHLSVYEARVRNALECYQDAPTEYRRRQLDGALMCLERLKKECGVAPAQLVELSAGVSSEYQHGDLPSWDQFMCYDQLHDQAPVHDCGHGQGRGAA